MDPKGSMMIAHWIPGSLMLIRSWWAGSEDHRPDEGNSSPEKEVQKWDTPELPIEGIFHEVTIGWVTRSMFTISIWPTCTAGPAGTNSGSYNFNSYRNLVSGFDVQPYGIMGILRSDWQDPHQATGNHGAFSLWCPAPMFTKIIVRSYTIFWKMPHENDWKCMTWCELTI